MSKYKKIIQDILYVSKVTKTKNKKILIIVSVIFSQLTALTDVFVIIVFAFIISGEIVGVSYVDEIVLIIYETSFILPLLVVFRFIIMFYQDIILKNIELNVSKNLKVYVLTEIIDKRNYSMADTFFYVNQLTTHISFFYSSFASLLNSALQIIAYGSYLVLTNGEAVGLFSVGIVFLIYPIFFIVKKARLFMHESYKEGQTASKELQRVVENLFLIKILKMEKYELDKFSNTLKKLNYNFLQNHKYGLYNKFIPNFFALVVISIALSITLYSNLISLVFIGVTLRLFQSFSGLTSSANGVINSHVHIEKFYEMEKNKLTQEKQNFKVISSVSGIQMKDVDFQYFNSDRPIFKNINLEITQNSHTILTGQNGSGKSTLLGLLSAVYFPSSGFVTSFSDKFAYIGANPLIFDSTIYENIMYGNNADVKESQLLDYLNKLEVFKEKSNYDLNKQISNKSLSSGQMQKLAFIRAILSDARILLLDEATANLDKKTKDEIINLVRDRGFTIINSTHLEEELENIDSHIEIIVNNENRILNQLK
jgi:ABC-type bacteriocin/lantibiotic exporter with double-glycine peptidase domain